MAEANVVRRLQVALPVLRVIAAGDAAQPRNESHKTFSGDQ
ncbi:MAG TPA: hypothetical protein VFE62_28475 [Gemmataceae bacterium]|nr:hypothetical protein [Gemmataceae bacterium]